MCVKNTFSFNSISLALSYPLQRPAMCRYSFLGVRYGLEWQFYYGHTESVRLALPEVRLYLLPRYWVSFLMLLFDDVARFYIGWKNFRNSNHYNTTSRS